MKKFISVFLCTVVFTVNVIFMPYATTVYASDLAGNVVKSISFDNIVKMVKSLYKVGYNVATTGSGDGAVSSKALDSIWGEDSVVNKWLQTKLFPFMDTNGNIDLTKDDCPISYNNEKQLVEFNPTFTNELSQQVQNSVHALDGYWLFETNNAWSPSNFITNENLLERWGASGVNKVSDFCSQYTSFIYFDKHRRYYGFNTEYCYLYKADSYNAIFMYNSNFDKFDLSVNYISPSSSSYSESKESISYSTLVADQYKYYLNCYGNPFKIFYSKKDLNNYLNQGRIYVPQLPSGGFKVNIKYINNTTNLPDITYNINTTNKTEVEIQNQFDTTFNNYLNDLNDFTDGGGGTTNPTPTPSGGGSGGDFGDGTTPTPKPDFTDGSLTDTNTLLQKILDKLTEFSANHDKLAKTITGYIEANDGKLDQIIEAINALSDGKTEDDKNGCKYDFTALSDFMTKLWNESDKKFDKMVELLEENNKYQKKLVNSLNEIKAILVTQTIMDVFQDRSQQTAEKAKDKFPTSLPWDIALVVNAMSAEPEKPQFNLPIQIKSLNINEEIHVDLASGEWEKLAKTCRYLLSILFILLMIQLSRKLFSNGGDD